MEIYCPECEWEPPPSAEWTCECGHHDWYHDLPPVDVDAIAEGEEAAAAV